MGQKKDLSTLQLSSNIEDMGGMAMASPTATLQKNLKFYVDQLMNLENSLFDEAEIPKLKSEIYEDGASKLQDIKMTHLQKTKLSLENEKLTLEMEQLRHGRNASLDEQLKRSTFALDLVIAAIEKRENKRKMASIGVDRNLLQHGVITFAGGRKKSVKNPDSISDNSRTIRFDKEGLKRLSYQNDRGQILSEFDTRVFLGLHKLWEKYGRNRTFLFTEYELLQTINVGTGGKEYELLQESLKTLFATSVVMQTYYKKNQNETIKTKWFHLIQSKDKIEKFIAGNRYSIEHEIEFSNYLQESLMAGYVSYISLAMLEDLQSQTAQAIYLTLSGEQPNEFGYYEFPLDRFSEHIYLTDVPSKNKAAIERACNELIKATIIDKFVIEINHRKVKMLRILPTDWFKTVRSEHKMNFITNGELKLLNTGDKDAI